MPRGFALVSTLHRLTLAAGAAGRSRAAANHLQPINRSTTMQITGLRLDRTGYYIGYAESTRGRRYKFVATRGGAVIGCDRQITDPRLPDRWNVWLYVGAHRSMAELVRSRIRKEERAIRVATVPLQIAA
jgi:hypothetical protein